MALSGNTLLVAPGKSHGVFRKTPAGVVAYTVDFTGALESGETLSTATWSEGGLTAGGTTQATPLTSITLSGGTADSNYLVSVSVTTSASRTVSATFTVQVRTSLV